MHRESGSLRRLVNVGKTKCWDFQLEYPVNNRQSLNVSGLATNIPRILGVPVVERDFYLIWTKQYDTTFPVKVILHICFDWTTNRILKYSLDHLNCEYLLGKDQ